MAVTTSFLPLTNTWVALGAAAPLMIQPVGGPIEIFISSAGVPSAGSSGILLYPRNQPFITFTAATGTVYAIAAGANAGVGVFVANAA
jgi:hypothetical protein